MCKIELIYLLFELFNTGYIYVVFFREIQQKLSDFWNFFVFIKGSSETERVSPFVLSSGALSKFLK